MLAIMDLVEGLTILALLGIVWYQRGESEKTSHWIEPTRHDVTLTSSGQYLHHSTCWCKVLYDQDTES